MTSHSPGRGNGGGDVQCAERAVAADGGVADRAVDRQRAAIGACEHAGAVHAAGVVPHRAPRVRAYQAGSGRNAVPVGSNETAKINGSTSRGQVLVPIAVPVLPAPRRDHHAI